MPHLKKLKNLSTKVWVFIHLSVNLLNYMPLPLIYFGANILQCSFPNGHFYLPKEVKMGGIFVSLKKVMKLFYKKFPLGAFQKQLGQFYVQTQ